MKINIKNVKPIDIYTFHIPVRSNKKDSFERSTKCGRELALTNISLNGTEKTSRSVQLPRASRPAGVTLQDIVSIVIDGNIHMDVRRRNDLPQKEGNFRQQDELLFLFLLISTYYTLR
jgi:hypothetical protein